MYTNVLVVFLLLSNAYALENVKEDAPIYPEGDSTQPSKEQIRMLITTFAPLFYFHPQEKYFPSSVTWFFDNGAMVLDPSPRAIINNGEDLPRNGTVDDAHLDLPADKDLKEKVKRGSLADAVAYIHAKPSLGGTCTDLVIWLFYPFNGGSTFQFGKFTFSLGKIGERVGDWEHITLRINNQRGALTAVYLSQHAKGKWLAPNDFKYEGGRLVVYASLHSHAHYNAPTRRMYFNAEYLLDPSEKKRLLDYLGSNNLEESSLKSSGVGLVDDATKSDNVFDILASPSSYELVSDDIGVDYSTPPPWLDYTGRWGPKVSYKLKDPATAGVILAPIPFYLKPVVLGVISTLPAEAFGEEGSEGPKMKPSWNGDERV